MPKQNTMYQMPFKYKIFSFVIVLSVGLVSCSKDPDFDDEMLQIEVNDFNKYIELVPETGMQSEAFMFYPGGLVEPEAYIPLLEPLVLDGYYVVIVKMPSDLAVLAPNRGVNLIEDELPSFDKWIISGHSLGGTMAVRALKDNEGVFSGLILVASYPADSDDISGLDIPVLSIHASEDGLSTIQDIEDTKELLPDSAEYFLIEGGNHAQFGSYGEQKDDGVATISAEEQKSIAATKMLEFLYNFQLK